MSFVVALLTSAFPVTGRMLAEMITGEVPFVDPRRIRRSASGRAELLDFPDARLDAIGVRGEVCSQSLQILRCGCAVGVFALPDERGQILARCDEAEQPPLIERLPDVAIEDG